MRITTDKEVVKITPEDVKRGIEQLTVLCHAIGCSGLTQRCPGDPKCGILQKIAPTVWAHETIKDAGKLDVAE